MSVNTPVSRSWPAQNCRKTGYSEKPAASDHPGAPFFFRPPLPDRRYVFWPPFTDRIAWANFAALDQAIDELLDDNYEVISEREAFLLREFQKMLQAENLIASAKDVVVVPARKAWPEYNQCHAYVCQPDRSFQQVSRIAFYYQGQIQPVIPKILEVHEHVDFNTDEHSGRLGGLISLLLKASTREEGKAYKVFLLSSPHNAETLTLEASIPNDLKARTGRTTAFTQSQRYVSSDKLMVARTTTDLIE